MTSSTVTSGAFTIVSGTVTSVVSGTFHDRLRNNNRVIGFVAHGSSPGEVLLMFK